MATRRGLENNMTEIEVLDLGGDVCLHVGAAKSKQLRIRASKTLLQFASGYFKALFGPQFNEGAIADAGKDIRLEDDDADAFALLCKILHMQYRSQHPPSWDELIALAIVADKYSCIESLRLSLDFLFSGKVPKDEPDFVLGKAVIASYLLDHPSLFRTFTQRMVADCNLPFTIWAKSELGRLLQALVWLELEASRSALKNEFADALLELIRCPCWSDYKPCREAVEWSMRVRTELSRNNLDIAPLDDSLSSLRTRILNLKIPNPPITRCSEDSRLPGREGMTDEELKARFGTVPWVGLCLDCVRREGKAKGVCRVAHSK